MRFNELRSETSIDNRSESMASTKPSTLRVVLRTTTRIIKQAFPHIVLITVYIGYLVLGAYGFCRLEHQGREDFKAMTNDCAHSIVNKFMNVSQSNISNYSQIEDNPQDEKMEKMLKDELESFANNLTRPEWKESRMQSHMIGRDFNFTSSFLFAMTTITTIGYGDIVPTTTAGRTFCIIYAMFGIPLTLLCLADIGDLLARLVLWLCKKLGINKCTRRIKVECSRSSPPEDNFRMHETTSPSGNQMGTKHGMKHDPHGMGLSHDDQGNGHHHRQPEHHHHHHNKGICTKDGTCQEEDVPIFVILVILASYICGVSALMSHIEHWTFGEAVYFTIITVTTIGFGDLVPTELYTHDAFMFCTFFTLLGMAMMSMTITLMKDKVVRLVTYLYHKIKLDH